MKPILGIVLAAGYLAALEGIVRHEGSEYRHELARRRKPVTASAAPPPPTTVPAAPAPAPPSIAAPAPPPMLATTKALDVAPRPVPPGVVAAAPSAYDPSRLSPEEMRERGAELSALVASGHPLRDDAASIRRLEALLRHLAPARSHPDMPIQFHILDSAGVNAFSHIGGHIYVTRGVFSLAQTDAELEFVIAHEVAHIELGHAIAGLHSIQRTGHGSPGLVPTLFHLIALGFTAELEFQADDWAYRALRLADRSHRQSVLFLRRYADYSEAHQLSGRRAPRTQLGDSRQDVENHYPAHPTARERLKRLEARRGG